MMRVGKTATVETVVSSKNTAKTIGSGSLDVFATPMMVALMEEAACKCIEGCIEDGQTSVGTMINTAHIAASPIGVNVRATATLREVDGRKLTFDVLAEDEKNEIGKGTHTRVIIDAARFMDKIKG